MPWLAFAALYAAQTGAAAPVNPPLVVIDQSASPATTTDCCVLKALTPVRLSLAEPLASDTAKPAQTFEIRLLAPIALDGGLVIPAGTRGRGEVVHAVKSGMAGKAGEMLLAARYLELSATRIPLRSLRLVASGKDQTGVANAIAIGTAVAAPLASPIALFITGGEVRVPAGTMAEAKVSADTRIEPAQLSAPADGTTAIMTREGTQE